MTQNFKVNNKEFATIITKDNIRVGLIEITFNEYDTEHNNPISQHYTPQENESIILDDYQIANELATQYTQVRWDKKKKQWIGEGEPIPQPEYEPTPDFITPLTTCEIEFVRGLMDELGDIEPEAARETGRMMAKAMSLDTVVALNSA